MNGRWLEKATLTTADITPSTGGGLLSPQQATEFIRVAMDESVLLQDTNVQVSTSPKFELPRISFANRILRAGVEATRVADADRVKPATALVTLSTALFKGEVPMSDETFEDNVEREGLADSIMEMLTQAIGRDVEEIAIKSDTARTGAELAVFDQFDGLIKQMQALLPGGQKIDATAYTEPDALFAAMLEALPNIYRRNYDQLKFYVPVVVADRYQAALAARGTTMGDQALVENIRANLGFRGIRVRPVPILSGTDTINTGAIDYSKFAMLVNPLNIYVGWHRRIRIERWRDPREGVTSFLPTLRFDVKFADPNYAVLASNVALPA
jgi:HK97 family phage major capsid protein